MKIYVLSLAAGVLVGIIYGVLNIRSPAPPVIALVGLLGILLGEQAVQLFKRVVSPQPVTIGWLKKECAPHQFGNLPVGESAKSPSEKSV